ncbi:hypothetical protein [Sulfurivermis fontis]|uniref:hypothetical protein n=1 Tax=Sulfurivermis fontis TaxID=1972068 RepID=UPI000FD96F24|nr:hypothetical protein [Sulfurivermis fontis]
MQFTTCVNRTACTEDGVHCRACGRSHDEIARLRQLTDIVAAFALEMDYDNLDDFLNYLTAKVSKKVNATRNERPL